MRVPAFRRDELGIGSRAGHVYGTHVHHHCSHTVTGFMAWVSPDMWFVVRHGYIWWLMVWRNGATGYGEVLWAWFAW